MGLTVSAYAASLSFPYNSRKQLEVNGQWQTIASSTGGGLNCYVVIAGIAEDSSNFDIQMLGADDNRLWYESNSLSSSFPRTYACGSDVYKIQIKTSTGSLAHAWAGHAGELN